MKQLIMDASVAIKWFFDESETDKARSFLRRLREKEVQMIVPELFYYEFANTCWKKVKKKLASFDDASQALDQLMELPLTRYRDEELADVAFTNAAQYDISAYDGLYLALAELYVAPLVTADEDLLARCRGRFDFIESLKNL